MLKQVILVRNDLKLPKGKLAVQVAHASVDAVLSSDKRNISTWCITGMKKVALKVGDLRELRSYIAKAKRKGLVVSVIKDAGLTTVRPGTITCAGIGPADEELLDELFGELKLV